MFNTELLIVEVQKRPCLWKTKDPSHSDRDLRIRAWNQIAKVFNASNVSYSLKSKNLTIAELQRKWKHLRDYYIREKKRSSNTEEGHTESKNNDVRGSTSRKKKKSPLLNMLQFLDANTETDIVIVTIERNEEEDNFYPENIEEDDNSLSEYETANPPPSKIKKTEIQHSHTNEQIEDLEDSADKQLLTSLLPIIRSMSAKEKDNFRSQLFLNSAPKECRLELENTRNAETRKQNKTIHIEEEIEDVNKRNKNIYEATFKRDEYSIFGEYIANKLRNIQNKKARHTAEFHINGILYKAEIGEYDTMPKDRTNATRSATSAANSSTRLIGSLVYQEDDSNDSSAIKAEVLD